MAAEVAAFAIDDVAAVMVVRERARALARRCGLDEKRAEELAIAVSEVGHNQLRHAKRGEITLRAIERAGTAGVEVCASDRGPGIERPADAFEGPRRSDRSAARGGLGIGLAGVRRLVDEIDLDARAGEKTSLWLRKLAPGAPRHREVALLARPETAGAHNGDDAVVVRDERLLTIAVADGLGHGADARVAAQQAIAVVDPALALTDLLAACERAVEQTRGCVLELVRLELATGALEHLAVGDATTVVFGPGRRRRFVATAGVLGKAPIARKVVEQHTLARDEVLVVHTDGLSRRLDLADERALLRRPALVIAQHLMEQHARKSDDVLVVVVR